MDIGCGIGDLLTNLRKKSNSVELYGIDYAENMINEAKKELVDNANLCVGDAENLPYDSNLFDFVISCAAFHHFPNPDKALFEMKRVMKMNSKLLVYEII